MAYFVERTTKIYNEGTGSCIEVGPDRDGLNLVEVRSLASDGREEGRLILTPEEVFLLTPALAEVATEVATAARVAEE